LVVFFTELFKNHRGTWYKLNRTISCYQRALVADAYDSLKVDNASLVSK